MSNIEFYFSQFKNYLFSNIKIIRILSSSNEQDYKNEWQNDLFYAISGEYIRKWKYLINFDGICLEYNINKNNKIDDWIKGKIINLFSEIPNLNDLLETLKYEPLNNSFYNSVQSNNEIFSFSEFDLITKNAWDLFIQNNNYIDGKVLIKKGNKKMIIKINGTCFIIFYLKRKYIDNQNNINDNEIIPYELNDYLNKLIIEIDDTFKKIKQIEINSFIYEMIKINIYEWLDKIQYNNQNKKYKYNFIDLIIKEDNKEEILSLNENAIPFQYVEIRTGKILLKDINYINTIIVQKIKYATYVIASMHCLSQIPEFSIYFYGDNIRINPSLRLLFLFKEYIDKLWKKNEKKEPFAPKEFISCLKYKYNKVFDFKEEKEPIIFIKKIFKYINKELNNKDKKIKNSLNEIANSYSNNPDFINYYNNIFIKKYNSIVSKVFYGILQIKYSCQSCNEENIEYKKFKYINLNINKYSNYVKEKENDLNNSLVYYYLDDLIEFYFNDKDIDIKCKKCKSDKQKLTEKKIIKFPDILIFRIEWEDFNYEKGFKSEDNWLDSNKLIFQDLETMDLSKYAFNNKKILYELNNVISYGVINEKNKKEKSWKKYMSFCRHLTNDKLYCYQANGNVREMHIFNRNNFTPSVLFYKK